MSEVPLYAEPGPGLGKSERYLRYRGTSRIRNNAPPKDHHRALGLSLL